MSKISPLIVSNEVEDHLPEQSPFPVSSPKIVLVSKKTNSNDSLLSSGNISGINSCIISASVDELESVNSSMKDSTISSDKGSLISKPHNILHTITQGLVDTMTKISSGRSSHRSSYRSDGSESPLLSESTMREHGLHSDYLGTDDGTATGNSDRRSVLSNGSELTPNGSLRRQSSARRLRLDTVDWKDDQIEHVAAATTPSTTNAKIGATVLYNFVSQYGQNY